MTMRLALGAGRRRLMKQLFTEGLLLSVIAAARRNRGRVLVPQRSRARVSTTGARASRLIIPDNSTGVFWLLSVAVCIGSTMLFALVPAIQASHVDLSGALKSEGSGVIGGSGRSRLRLDVGARSSGAEFCSPRRHWIAFAKPAANAKRRSRISRPTTSSCRWWICFRPATSPIAPKFFTTQLLDRVRALPGVRVGGFGAGEAVQLCGLLFRADSRSTVISRRPMSNRRRTTIKLAKDYFATLGIPIVAGREFTRNDDENAPPVAIVNETMAAKYWPGKDRDRPAPQGERQMDGNRGRGEECELPDQA